MCDKFQNHMYRLIYVIIYMLGYAAKLFLFEQVFETKCLRILS